MSTELILDVGQANELKLAFRREGWTNKDIKTLCEKKGLGALFLDVLEGRSEIKPVEYLVDLDADPFIPQGWSLAKYHDDSPCHLRGGLWKYDPTKVKLYLSEKQQGGSIVGHNLRKKLEGRQPVMNANMLEFYLKHPHLIPSEWRGKAIFFWGTIFLDVDDNLCVRCLCWRGGCLWAPDYFQLNNDFSVYTPAVVLIK